MSVCWFIRCFRTQMGITPQQYLTEIRLSRAKELLAASEYPVGEVAAMVGYGNPLYFSRIFRQRVGVSPLVYRRQVRE